MENLIISDHPYQDTYTPRELSMILLYYRKTRKLPNCITDEEILALFKDEIEEENIYNEEDACFEINRMSQLWDTFYMIFEGVSTDEIREELNTYK